ncbi:MAG: hypothetical protein ACFCVF_06350 [Kineosporiaceae bacterium]
MDDGDEDRGRAGRALLESAIRSLPVPPARPDRSTRQRVGLHLLLASLRWEHVDRVSQTLTLVEASHLDRRVDIDVDLARLTRARRRALTLEPWRDPDGRPTLWLPVARHERRSLGPVTCYDGAGTVLPRMTGREVNRLMAAAVIAVLRQLRAHPPGGPPTRTPPPRHIGEPARWLVETALSAIVEDGRVDWPVPSESAAPGPYLDEALTWLDVPPAFHRLLYDIARDQVVVVRLPAEPHQTRVSYDAPQLRASPPRRGSLSALVSTQQVSVAYTTTIPGHLDSYHVTLQVPQQMSVRHMLMTSDADRRAVRALRADALLLARSSVSATPDPASETPQPTESLLRYETGSAGARMGELVLRRREDALEYARYLRDRRLPGARSSVPPVALGNGPVPVLSDSGRRAWADAVADAIERDELDYDLHVDNDPREANGHVQWRRHGAGLGLGSYRSVRAHVLATLVDARPSGAGRLLAALLANALLVTLVFGLLLASAGGPGRLGDAAEPLLTLLLLVPGLIIALISLQQRRRLRSLVVLPQHYIGWPAIGGNILLAVVALTADAVAATGSGPARVLTAAAIVLVALQWLAVLALTVLMAIGRAVDRLRHPPFEFVPRWLRGHGRTLVPTMSFDGRPRELVTLPDDDRGAGAGRYLPRATLVDVTLRASEDVHVRVHIRHVHGSRDGAPARVHAQSFLTDVDDVRQWVTTDRLVTGALAEPAEVQDHPGEPPGGSPYDASLVRVARERPARTVARRPSEWTALVRTEAAFFYTFTDKVDLLLTLSPGEWSPTDRPSAARVTALTCDVLAEIAAPPHYRPVTFVRSPSVGFRDVPAEPLDFADPGSGPWGSQASDPLLARGVNVRITVGLDDRDHESRQSLLARVVATARRHGAALHVADRRFGPLTGRWVPVQGLAQPTTPSEPAAGPAPAAGDPSRLQQVTVLGPARQGSFVSVLAALREARVAAAALTALSMQDVSALMLMVTDGAVPAGDYHLDEYLARHGAPGGTDRTPARGYRCLVSPPVAMPEPRPGTGHPIWASWEIRGPAAPSPPSPESGWRMVLAAVLAHPEVADAQVEYHRMRRTSPTSTMERLKLAVTLHGQPGDTAERLDALCRDVFHEVLSRERQARVAANAARRMVRVRVEARERWLGSWIDDPG